MTFQAFLAQIHAALHLEAARYDGNRLLGRQAQAMEEDKVTFQDGDAQWQCRTESSTVPDRPDAYDLRLTFQLMAGVSPQTSVSAALCFRDWKRDSYVLMPAAAYNGNRFDVSMPSLPPPMLGLHPPATISDQARLNIGDGPSCLQQLTRDLATPAVGIFFPQHAMGLWLLTDQKTLLGDSGLSIEENADRTEATLRLSVPGMRESAVHKMWKPYPDRGADFQAGDAVSLRFRLYAFPCADIPALAERFAQIRKDLTGPVTLRHELPFSAAWAIQEEKTNTENWNEEHGYLCCGVQEQTYSRWQLGWCGGLMNTLAMFMDGDARSRAHARRTFDFAFSTQEDSGLMWPVYDGTTCLGDGFGAPYAESWHLARRSGDILYFLLKQFRLLRTQNEAVPAHWTQGAQRLADAVVRIWEENGQFGQYWDVRTGKLAVGGSASGALLPGALALASEEYSDARFLAVAAASAEEYCRNFVQRGYTNGGPGDALQCPDSESAYALLESLVTLYEVTGDRKWVSLARDAAFQCATWNVSYDFQFPPSSLFGRLGMKTTGAVYANIQNKHGSPGICTLSGVSLFKLWRVTGELFFLELLRETAHNLTQYLSRLDRPVGKMPPGWMTERVNLSDWAEGVGEIFEGSCWCETSLMLTWAEVPGLYVQPDTGFLCAFDHIDARVVRQNDNELIVSVSNPTAFEARVKIWAENSDQTATPLGQNFLHGCRQITVPAGGVQEMTFAK